MATRTPPSFARRLDVVLFEAADDDGFLDEGAAIVAMDYFLLQRRLSDGRTVLERFVAQRRPPLSEDEREMLLGWHDVVDGCFEVRRFDGDAVLLHNLIDDLVYRVHSNMGRKGFTGVRVGMFLVTLGASATVVFERFGGTGPASCDLTRWPSCV